MSFHRILTLLRTTFIKQKTRKISEICKQVYLFVFVQHLEEVFQYQSRPLAQIFSLTLSLSLYILPNLSPALPGKKLMSLHHPSGHFTFHKVFSPVTHLGFGVWGTLGSRGRVCGVMLVLRTFPELGWRSVQNLVEIGPAVWA